MTYFIAAYLICINLAGLASMWLDKRKAIRHQWRIPEATLFFIALLGGGLGSIVGMQLFRHKTRHWYFVWGMPAIFFTELALAIRFMLK
ncbi:hypothetical protein IMSAGC003_02661 [Lachnospiraceae bacterium]|jgi:uncharacterized membrane protein YsdA (DUF1294 family)|nr:DUF1294 domain-containing protein [Lachnospiraceae bacterium]MCX4271287.1 DUF1294 domain-containing protein [Acetatifactor sp.]GFH96107.1 hypothetical protein IMSAGC003_02661 [Lachnospiraceae bacterium]